MSAVPRGNRPEETDALYQHPPTPFDLSPPTGVSSDHFPNDWSDWAGDIVIHGGKKFKGKLRFGVTGEEFCVGE